MRLRSMPTLEALGRCKRWLPVAALAACLMSCAYSGGVDGPVLSSPLPDGRSGGMDAVVGGMVVFDESAGCLYLELSSEYRHPVVWPVGASWQADPPAVKIHGLLVEPGMFVEGGGGYISYGFVRNVAGDEVADAAQACVNHVDADGIAFFNVGSRVDVILPPH